jgi:NCS1 family nucleobase:cation symporter-1
MYGSSFVIWNRILLSLGMIQPNRDLVFKFADLNAVWYGFQAWIGGECLYVCLLALSPSLETHIPNHMPASTGMTTAQFVAYILFSVISLPVIYIRPHKLKNFFYISSSTILIFEIVLLIWALATMGPEGFGNTISSTPTSSGSTGWLVAYGIISTIGSIAAGILNQNDYARFAHRPRDAIMGQIFSFAPYAIICSVIGILVTAATQNRFGGALWNLPDIFTTLIQQGGSRERAASFFAGAALVISQIGVNVPGNALSGGFDLAATFPRFINIRRGAYITAVVSTAVNPWKLVNTATVFISVLGSYSVFLGPMTGLMISSYFIVNKRKINIDDLFVGNKNSIYWYSWGINWRAIVAAGTPQVFKIP